MRTLIQYSENKLSGGTREVQFDLAGSLKIEACDFVNGVFLGQCVIEPHGAYFQDGLSIELVRSTRFYLETR